MAKKTDEADEARKRRIELAQERWTGLTWNDLKRGDRVSHFDYGVGTVDASGPLWILITWDNPDERVNTHTAAISRWLTVLQPAA